MPNKRTARAAYPLVAVGLVAILVLVDRSASDVANQVALLVLLLGAGALGALNPPHPWLGGVLIGSTLAVAHFFYETLGVSLPYAMSPPGLGGALTLLVLIIPAVLAAYAGALTRRLAGR